ncbi:putative xylitol dehydrogenase protein [Eutypa lata UCREL1]|uniref:D-xylulose reductase n=1 Tax=Eutypa lata (strain UCR-EL1) TaxID=1287681 RepID=M7SIU6_EUTLA|nr:putative xylitol dehydrogenase protein [Eutypa lata UCREL1]
MDRVLTPNMSPSAHIADVRNATEQTPPLAKALELPPNMSCLLVKKRTIKIEPIPTPKLQPDGVLVKVLRNGICGSDMHGYLSGGVGGRPVLEPLVMGHEAAGEVIAVGELVTTHKPGDRVAGYSADTKQWNPGSHVENVSTIGVQIGKRADIRPHETIAIFGCGPIGLITAAVAHAYSARKIIAFDISPSRVEFARKYLSPLTGRPIIDHVFHIEPLPGAAQSGVEITGRDTSPAGDTADMPVPTSTGESHHHEEEVTEGDFMWGVAQERMAEIVRQCGLEAEEGVDTVVEASGAGDSMLHGVAICKQGSTYLQVGLGHVQTHVFPTIAVTNKELDVKGITRYTASCFPSAIDLLARGVVDLKPLITATFPLSKAKDALEAVASGKEIKVIIRNQEA